MAQLILNIPDAVLQRVLDGFGTAQGYVMLGGSLTKAQFLKRVVTDFIITSVKSAEGQTAVQQAKQTSDASVDTNIAIT